jgi:large subunit ribosomal protein L22
MKAILTNYRQTPRKVRLVTDLIKGKKVQDALHTLTFLPKRAALPIQKLLSSAVANAKNTTGVAKESLVVKNIQVNEGMVLRRSMPRARGSASQILKRSSTVTLELSQK